MNSQPVVSDADCMRGLVDEFERERIKRVPEYLGVIFERCAKAAREEGRVMEPWPEGVPMFDELTRALAWRKAAEPSEPVSQKEPTTELDRVTGLIETKKTKPSKPWRWLS